MIKHELTPEDAKKSRFDTLCNEYGIEVESLGSEENIETARSFNECQLKLFQKCLGVEGRVPKQTLEEILDLGTDAVQVIAGDPIGIEYCAQETMSELTLNQLYVYIRLSPHGLNQELLENNGWLVANNSDEGEYVYAGNRIKSRVDSVIAEIAKDNNGKSKAKKLLKNALKEAKKADEKFQETLDKVNMDCSPSGRLRSGSQSRTRPRSRSFFHPLSPRSPKPSSPRQSKPSSPGSL